MPSKSERLGSIFSRYTSNGQMLHTERSEAQGSEAMQFLITLLLGSFAASAFADDYIYPKDINWIVPSFRERLKKHECRIPRQINGMVVSGIVSGQFASRGQTDLAVICVTESESTLMLYWGGNVKCADSVQSYGQSISSVGESYIMNHYKYYGGNKPPRITHEGINDMILEKASSVRYCHDGKWLKLTGAD